MISDEESPIQISRLETSGMLDQLLHVTVIPRALLKNKGNPGHQPQEAYLDKGFLFIKHMHFWDLNVIIYSCMCQESCSAFTSKFNRAISMFVLT